VKSRQGVRYYQHDPQQRYSLSSDPVLSLFEDSHQRMWIGTWAGGVNRYEEDQDRFIHYLPKENDSNSLSNPNVYAIGEYAPDKLLVSSYHGLNVLVDEEKGYFERYLDDEHEPNNYLRQLYTDRKGTVWVGTINELLQFDPVKKTYIRLAKKDPAGFGKIKEVVNNILEDKKGRLWVGTNSGLHEVIGQKYATQYTVENGLPSNIIHGILEDSKGNLWLSTAKGIARFNPDTKAVQNYDVSDGLLSNEFKPGACFKSEEGLFFFGGKGVNVFHPDSIRANPYVPSVFITDLKLFNQSVQIGEKEGLIQQQLSETRELSLKPQYNFFSISYLAVNLTASNKNQYAYKLEGFDKDWVYVGSQRSATFTNLNPGTYTFRVKASNNDGLWNEEGTFLTIHILPRWWQTWWFKLITTLLMVLLIYGGFRLNTYRIRARNRELEKKVLERTNKIEQQKQEIASQRDNLDQLNRELEQKVDERTYELQSANEALNASLDDLTHIHRQLLDSNSEVKKSLREKEVLLAEVHHRVKNNLAVISGLLQMQIFKTNNQETQDILQDSQNRIKSMSLIHEKLYQNGTFASVEFDNYITDLVSEIQRSYPEKAKMVEVNLHLEPIQLELTVAIPCGLLLNELLTNVYKHAFSGRQHGRIDIVFAAENEHYVLKVQDNGVGLEPGVDLKRINSMGIKLIHTLAKQLKGHLAFVNANGLTFTLTFAPIKMKTWA
jgi:two-component sensor histidine kinase/sugar lactone lactonase YvrE